MEKLLSMQDVKELEEKGKATFLPYGKIDKYFLMANSIVYYWANGAYHFLARQEDVYSEFTKQ